MNSEHGVMMQTSCFRLLLAELSALASAAVCPVTQHFYMTFSCSMLVAKMGSEGRIEKKSYFGGISCFLQRQTIRKNKTDRQKEFPDLHQGAEFREERKRGERGKEEKGGNERGSKERKGETQKFKLKRGKLAGVRVIKSE